jgi:hypothetical protein
MESWNHGIMESWNHGIMESWNHGIMAYGIMALFYQFHYPHSVVQQVDARVGHVHPHQTVAAFGRAGVRLADIRSGRVLGGVTEVRGHGASSLREPGVETANECVAGSPARMHRCDCVGGGVPTLHCYGGGGVPGSPLRCACALHAAYRYCGLAFNKALTSIPHWEKVMASTAEESS